MPSLHQRLQLAKRIHAAYLRQAAQAALEQQVDWSQLEHRFHLAKQQRQLVDKARQRGWHLAADSQQIQLRSLLRVVAESLREAQEKLLLSPPRLPSLKDLLAELQNLDLEFDDVVWDQKGFVAVHTDSIVLKDIDLGRFAIRFYWPRLAQNAGLGCFDVVALDSNSARRNEDVTHPHVRSRQLCAGEATLPLQKAIEQGRLTDAFHLIRSVLETYNPDSAYASLDDWEGVSCWNCGYTTSEDDRSFCEGCDQDVCSDCTSMCKSCDRIRCASCKTKCDVCNETCCQGCLTTSACSELSCCQDCLCACTECGAEVAKSEIDGESDLCPTCCEAQATAEGNTSETKQSIPAPTP